MTTATWHEGETPLKYDRGLPEEIHFWKRGNEIFILRDSVWHLWPKGVAIQDVGLHTRYHIARSALYG